MQPFGNHLTSVMTASAHKPEYSIFDKFFLNKHLSKVYIYITGISCSADALYFDMERKEIVRAAGVDATIFLAGELHNQNLDFYTKEEVFFSQKLLDSIVSKCDVNKAFNGVPPIVNAIMAYDYYLYSLLLKHGANLDMQYKTIVSKKTLTPRELIEYLLNRSEIKKEQKEILLNMKKHL